MYYPINTEPGCLQKEETAFAVRERVAQAKNENTAGVRALRSSRSLLIRKACPCPGTRLTFNAIIPIDYVIPKVSFTGRTFK